LKGNIGLASNSQTLVGAGSYKLCIRSTGEKEQYIISQRLSKEVIENSKHTVTTVEDFTNIIEVNLPPTGPNSLDTIWAY
jgi:hypothetical protein